MVLEQVATSCRFVALFAPFSQFQQDTQNAHTRKEHGTNGKLLCRLLFESIASPDTLDRRGMRSFMAKSIGYEADISPFPWSHPRLVPERLRVEDATPHGGARLYPALPSPGWHFRPNSGWQASRRRSATLGYLGKAGWRTVPMGERYGHAWGLSGHARRYPSHGHGLWRGRGDPYARTPSPRNAPLSWVPEPHRIGLLCPTRAGAGFPSHPPSQPRMCLWLCL